VRSIATNLCKGSKPCRASAFTKGDLQMTHRELPLQRRPVDGRLEIYQTSLLVGGPMFRFGRDKATEISRWQRSQDFSMTADIDAKLPERPSLEGYKVGVPSLDSVVHLFKKRGRFVGQHP
jgi:hypothetical protein